MLTFDAMWVRSEYVYREYLDRIVGLVDTGSGGGGLGERCTGDRGDPANLLLVFMLRSIFSKWKQVIGYALVKHGQEMPHTKRLMMQALRRSNAIGANVALVTCDMDTSQQRLASELGVSAEHPFFSHPSTGLPVYFVFDQSHLIKCVRNNLLNYDIEYVPGKFASWRVVKALYLLEQRSELKSATKLTQDHVKPSLGKKMSVRHATEVFSHSVAASMMAYLDIDAYRTLPPFARVSKQLVRDTAEFIRMMNRLWDILNAAHTAESYGKKAITRPLLADRLQELALDRQTIMGWRFISQRPSDKVRVRDTLPFKRGMCITLAAMQQVCACLFENQEVSFVAPRRFNQDCLENTFCQVRRDKGSFNDVLDTSRAVANLRAVAFSTILSSVTSACSNCPDDEDMVLIDCFKDLPPRIIKRPCAVPAATVSSQIESEAEDSSGSSSNRALSDSDDVDALPFAAGPSTAPSFTHVPDEWHDSLDDAWRQIVSEEVSLLDKVQYVAGYLLQKAMDKRCPFADCDLCRQTLHAEEYEQRAFMRRKTFDFAVRGLLTPSGKLLDAVHTWESAFLGHFERLLSGASILRKLQDLVPEMPFLPECHAAAVREFLTRTFFRMRIHHACRLRTRQLRDSARRSTLRKMAKLGTPTLKAFKGPPLSNG